MNITKISQQTTNKMTKFFQEKGDFGESVNIAMDFVGKAAVTPALIMLSPSKDATKDEKTFAAIKNPIGATIQLACEVPILIGVSKAVEKMANNGTFDKENSDFSYNVKNAQDIFVKTVKENDNIDENLTNNILCK